MNALDVMTPEVVTIRADDTVAQCAATLLEHHISALPVVDAEARLVGIVSEGDLIRRAEIGTDTDGRSWWLRLLTSRREMAQEYVKTHSKQVRDVMTREVVTVTPQTTLARVAALLEQRRIKRVPVVDNGRLVGIVSRANLLQALAAKQSLLETSAGVLDDRELRARLIEALRESGWGSGYQTNLVVVNGVVELFGIVDNDEERRAARVLIENTAGVSKVLDHRLIASQLPVGA